MGRVLAIAINVYFRDHALAVINFGDPFRGGTLVISYYFVVRVILLASVFVIRAFVGYSWLVAMIDGGTLEVIDAAVQLCVSEVVP